MFGLLPHVSRDCQGVRRREFLRLGALSGLGLSLPALLKHKQALAAQGQSTKELNCILIWTQGGTSHHDTFDPKPNAPVAVRGEFKAIDTAVPGVQFTEVCSRMAKEFKRFSILRSWNPMNGSHGVADAYVLSGKRFNPALTFPCYGSVVSHQKGFRNALPPYVQLGDSMDHRNNGGFAGYLGLEHNPFMLMADPAAKDFAVRDITPPKGIDAGRIARRRTMLEAIDHLQRKSDLQPAAYHALDEHYEAALNMITAPETKRAFDLNSEKDTLRDAYGRTRFGQSCLLARRLIESGVRFVTVTDPGWDTHQNNFTSLKKTRMPPVDQGLPQLLIDLEERGMLDSTMVVWLTDFGRTPKINSASGRDHWASAGFVMMAGAGVEGGTIVGRTDDEGGAAVDDPYTTEDVAATIYTKLGIPLDLITMTPDGRPILLNEGRPVREWV
ncbi:MAG: DUF1501 domain-containing protein [Planctomycetes bacterium]|nr:DUF1501 domain-containing protein [Planctomycetota bacterium]